MKIKLLILLLPIFLYLVGCSTPIQQVPPNTHAIILKEAQSRKLPVGSVSVPAGVYQPDFAAKNGIYYRASGHLIVKAFGISALQRGGIFIPYPPTEAEKLKMEKEKSEAERIKKLQNQNVKGMGASNSSSSSDKFLQGVW